VVKGAEIEQDGESSEEGAQVVRRAGGDYATRRARLSLRRVDLPTGSTYGLIWPSCARSSRSSKASLRSLSFLRETSTHHSLQLHCDYEHE
jgi:hypothetical protein